jgi:hypothetical protein
MQNNYNEFISRKMQLDNQSGFEPLWLPDFLFDFQKSLVDWSVRKGRAAIFADCGLGKTPMQLVWAENIVRKTNKPVLILTPLSVSYQTLEEANKFDIQAIRTNNGYVETGINITNYERLHYFNPDDFAGCVCDESSILKSFDGTRRKEITEFMKKIPYRLLCTATAAPNDYIEFGTSSEALGELGYTDMLTRFFKNNQNTIRPMSFRHHGKNFAQLDEDAKWRFKGHAELNFWRWVSSWARACRKPSDLGFEDKKFILPKLIEQNHFIKQEEPLPGTLFAVPAIGLKEQRQEGRRSLDQRCELAASLVSGTKKPALMWCHLNDEGDILSKLVSGSQQISGKDSDEEKEEKFIAFTSGQLRVLITKPKIGAWGLNFQHCSHMTSFPSHSFEQYYQAVRRCWRFGQKNKVVSDMIASEGGKAILQNLQRKSVAAENAFSNLTKHMNDALKIERNTQFNQIEEVPSWL